MSVYEHHRLKEIESRLEREDPALARTFAQFTRRAARPTARAERNFAALLVVLAVLAVLACALPVAIVRW